MNRNKSFQTPWKFIFRIGISFRRLFPVKNSYAFGIFNSSNQKKIECVYVINLDREPTRWIQMKQELKHVLDWSGSEIMNLTKQYHAVDARNFIQYPNKDKDIDPVYTLGDQLYVEPQPLTLPSNLDLNSPVLMSRSEIAVARSHIDIWRRVATSGYEYVLILEDDVWFRYGFAKHLDQVWHEIEAKREKKSMFDILYLSYAEVKNGAPKTFLTSNVFCPERGLWYLSGYVISRKGAEKLLHLLPCRGPVDLWINHKFPDLDVCAAKQSIISQRRDFNSTNSYSILPVLTKIGIINSEAASLFHIYPNEQPVFAFGAEDSGLSSLAMALSMLGYRCCSDLQTLPSIEQDKLLSGGSDCIFNAYVNIESLVGKVGVLRWYYPKAKFIITANNIGNTGEIETKLFNELIGADIAVLQVGESDKWRVLCKHLRCTPPSCSFPRMVDLGQRQLLNKMIKKDKGINYKSTKWDKSPWVAEFSKGWEGLHLLSSEWRTWITTTPIRFKDDLKNIDTRRWLLREDTFTDNLALFCPSNIEFCNGANCKIGFQEPRNA